MPLFDFTAMGPTGQEQSGTIEAANEEQAIAKLKNEGYYPTFIGAQGSAPKKKATPPRQGGGSKKGKSISFGSGNMKHSDITLFTRQLAILLDAGLPLIRALKTLERQSPVPAVKSVLGGCAQTVEGGSTFSEALSQYPKSFDKLYLNMIKAGEAAGAMESILNRLAEFMEKAARISAKVKSAMIYPCVVLSIAILITVALLIFIVPKFEQIFKDLLGEEAELPLITQYVVATSDMLQRGFGFFADNEILKYVEGPVEIVLIIMLFVFLFKTVAATPAGNLILDKIKFRIPLFGPIISRTAIARFGRTLGTLLGAGVPVLQALQIVKETAGNQVVIAAVEKIHDAVKDGEGISKPLAATEIFPQMVVAMVEVGEETGKLPEMLTKVADTYEEEVDNAVGALTSAIEPIMIVSLAVIVGTIVIALFMPMIAIIEQMGAK